MSDYNPSELDAVQCADRLVGLGIESLLVMGSGGVAIEAISGGFPSEIVALAERAGIIDGRHEREPQEVPSEDRMYREFDQLRYRFLECWSFVCDSYVLLWRGPDGQVRLLSSLGDDGDAIDERVIAAIRLLLRKSARLPEGREDRVLMPMVRVRK